LSFVYLTHGVRRMNKNYCNEIIFFSSCNSRANTVHSKSCQILKILRRHRRSVSIVRSSKSKATKIKLYKIRVALIDVDYVIRKKRRWIECSTKSNGVPVWAYDLATHCVMIEHDGSATCMADVTEVATQIAERFMSASECIGWAKGSKKVHSYPRMNNKVSDDKVRCRNRRGPLLI